MQKIAVVIPFYQRNEGILAKSLASVLSQPRLDDVVVHIVDDASPVPPDRDIAAAQAMLGPERLVLHRKPNGGPGSARNFALDRLENTEFVAFLDSDDEWSPTHLSNMREAMKRGADFYFSDYVREGSDATRFAQTAFQPDAHDEREGLREFRGDLFSVLLYGSPVGTSTVGYRFSAMPALRFHSDWRAGEDIFFWMEIAKQTSRIFFSSQCEVRYGRGVNIFEGCEWGTTEDLARLRNVSRFHRTVSRRFSLDDSQAQWNANWLKQLDESFMTSFLSALKKRQHGCLNELYLQTVGRPQVLGKLVPAVRQLLAGKSR